MREEDIIKILAENGFEVLKREPRGLIVYSGYDVGRMRLDEKDVEIHYHFDGNNYGSDTMAMSVAKLRRLLDERKIPYMENPTREEFEERERSLIKGLERAIVESRKRIAIVEGEA